MNIFIVLALYTILLIGMILVATKNKTSEDHLIAGRNRSWYQVLLSKFAASVGVGWFITYTAYAYEFGLAMVGFILGAIIGYILFAFWVVPKIYGLSKTEEFHTSGDLIEYKVGDKRLRRVFDFFLASIQSVWLLVTFVGGAQIISKFGFVSYEAALLITAFVVCIYLFIGGFKAVMITDILQAAIVLILLLLITGHIIGDQSVSSILATQAASMSLGDMVGFLIYGVFSSVVFSDRYQIIFAAKNQKQAQWGFVGALIPILITAFLLVIIGLFMQIQNNDLDPGLVFVHAMENFLNPTFLMFALVVFFAGLMSSADSYIHAISSQIVFASEKLKKKKVKMVQVVTLFVIIFVTTITYFVRDIVDITVFAAGLSLTPSIAMIYIFCSKEVSNRILMMTLISGLVGFLGGISIIGLSPVSAVFPIIAGTIGLGIGKVFIKFLLK